MTTARFDLMNAIGTKGMKQSDLWRLLRVVRSVVCEMVRSLMALGWVKRVRAADGRTWLVQLTRRGREVFARVSRDCVENGDMTMHMDAGLVRGHVELDSRVHRERFNFTCENVLAMYGRGPELRGKQLYLWHPEDYWTWLTDPDDPTGTERIPWVVPLESA